MLHAHFGKPQDGPGHLVLGHAVLGIPWHIHDGIAQTEGAAGIVAQAHGLRHFLRRAGQQVYMGSIVQIDIGPQFHSPAHILLRGHVGGEHDLVTGDAHSLGQQQLCIGGAVAAAAFLMEDLQNVGVGGGLHGKILLESGVPGEGFLHFPGIFPNACLVIQVEGGRDLGGNGLRLLQGHKGGFLHGCTFLFL